MPWLMQMLLHLGKEMQKIQKKCSNNNVPSCSSLNLFWLDGDWAHSLLETTKEEAKEKSKQRVEASTGRAPTFHMDLHRVVC